MKKATLVIAACLTLASCGKKSDSDLLVGKWRVVSQEDPQMTTMIEEQLRFIDTVGQNTTPEQNIAEYGTNNMDSFKAMQREQIEAYKKEQDEYLKNITFEFRKNGTIIYNYGPNVDSAKWKVTDKGLLEVDESQSKGQTAPKVMMDIVYVTDTALKLTFLQNNVSVIFHPDKK